MKDIKEQISDIMSKDYVILNLPYDLQSHIHSITTSKEFINSSIKPLMEQNNTCRDIVMAYIFQLIMQASNETIPILNVPREWRVTLINAIVRDHYKNDDIASCVKCHIILCESLRKLHFYNMEGKSSSQKYRVIMKTLIDIERRYNGGEFYESYTN